MPAQRPRTLPDQLQLAITNCGKTGKSQDWTLPGRLRITVAQREPNTFTVRLARQGSIPSISDVEFIRAALPQLASATRTPTTGYNRSQDDDGKFWRWVSFTFRTDPDEVARQSRDTSWQYLKDLSDEARREE